MAQDPSAAMEAAYSTALAAYNRRQAEVSALEQGAALMGTELPAILGAEMIARIEVADSVWERIETAVGALRSGDAALVELDSGWAVVPRAILAGLTGSFLSGWQIWVGAAAAVLAFAATFYLADYYLEVAAAEAQNTRLHADLQTRAQTIIEDLCRRYPDQCAQIQAQYQESLAAAAAGRPSSGLPGFGGGLLAGIGGTALLIFAALFFMRDRDRA